MRITETIRTATLACAAVALVICSLVVCPACGGKKKSQDDTQQSETAAGTAGAESSGDEPEASGDKPEAAGQSGSQDGDEPGKTPKGYAEALAKGQKLAKEKKYTKAIAAFEAALAAEPGDARALSELSWVAFRAGKLDQAKKAAQDSIAAAKDPRLKAASLYNLGRVVEANGDTAAAKAAYKQSLDLRSNKTVARRLAVLSSPIQPSAVEGPYKDEKEFCDKTRAELDPSLLEDFECAFRKLDSEPELDAPFLEVLVADISSGGGSSEWHLAMKVDAGWFLLRDWTYVEGSFREVNHVVIGVDNTRLVAEHNEITHVRESIDDEGGPMAFVQVSDADLLTICGVGKSGKVSCVPTLQTRYDGRPSETSKPTVKAELKSGDQLSIKVTAENGVSRDDIAAIKGKHKLVFP